MARKTSHLTGHRALAFGAAVVAQSLIGSPDAHAQEFQSAGHAAVTNPSMRVASPVRSRRPRPSRRPAAVAGLPLARPSTATDPNLAPGGSLDSRAAAPKWGLFGNLGGVRDDLYRAGIRVDAGIDYEGSNNVQGGTRQLTRGSGQFVFRGTGDMNQLVGIEGGTVNFIFTQRFGRSLPNDANLGVLQQTEEVFGRGNIPRLTTLSYDQQFGPNVDLKFGRMPVGSDFAGFACEFQNLTFCGAQPGNTVGTTGTIGRSRNTRRAFASAT